MANKANSLSHTKWMCKYHIVFTPKYSSPTLCTRGTANGQEIATALQQTEEDNKENARDEWEVFKEIAEKFPDLKNGEIILRDKDYVSFGRKDYLDSDYKSL